MTDAELIFTMLAELTTRQVAEKVNAFGVDQNKKAAVREGACCQKCQRKL